MRCKLDDCNGTILSIGEIISIDRKTNTVTFSSPSSQDISGDMLTLFSEIPIVTSHRVSYDKRISFLSSKVSQMCICSSESLPLTILYKRRSDLNITKTLGITLEVVM